MTFSKKEQLKRLLRDVRDRRLSRRLKMRAVSRILEGYDPVTHVGDLTDILREGDLGIGARLMILMMLFTVGMTEHKEAEQARAALKAFALDRSQPKTLRDHAMESLMLMGLAKPAAKA